MADKTTKKQPTPTKAELEASLRRQTSTAGAAPIDQWVPDSPTLMEELNISAMCIYRYERNPRMDFPKAFKLTPGGRKFRSRAAIEAWKARMMKDGIVNRSKPKKAEASADRRALEP